MKTSVAWVCVVPLGIATVCGSPALAQEPDGSPPKPSLIGSTYTVPSYWGTETIHLYEESGKLKWDGKTKVKAKLRSTGMSDREWSGSIDYDKVNFVQYVAPVIPQESHLQIGLDSAILNQTLQLPAETSEGQALAEYVARQSPHGLELIGRAWRIRKHFQCPESMALGCRDFKDLLDHGDPDIAEYFYAHDETTRTYACFRNEEEGFFILQYSNFLDSGTFSFEDFLNQQSDRSEFGQIKWHNENGFITQSKLLLKPGVKPQSLGAIDLSSLSYETNYPNKEETTTRYTLSVRLSTGRFTESYSGRGKSGKLFTFDKTGVCAKLN